ncbi:unnamed protein product [Sympodiomycopsis kandeliae]
MSLGNSSERRADSRYHLLGTPHANTPSRSDKMTKGTTSFGKRHTKTHTICRRCNSRAFHRQHKVCASCGYPAASMRSFNWGKKAHRRRTTGTGRCAYLKTVPQKAKNGFRTGVATKKTTSASA